MTDLPPGPPSRSAWTKGAAYMGLAFVPAIAGWLGYQAGGWLDARLGTRWIQVTGLLVGLAAGIYDMLRQAQKIEGIGKQD